MLKEVEISVVIPMYNASNTIIRCINSVLAQSYDCILEIVVINDGSTDDSEEIVRYYFDNHPNLSAKLIAQKNGGVSKARNTGIKNSSGKYIAFLDSDDEWYPNKIEEQMRVFNSKKKHVDFVGSGYEGLYFEKKNQGDLIKMTSKGLLYKNYFQPSSVVMKKEIVDKIGYFDETQRYAEDGNYFIRIANDFNCYFLNMKLINFGDGKAAFGHSGLSGNILEMEKGELKNINDAYNLKIINFGEYIFINIFSVAKFMRRWLIVKFSK